MITLHNTHKYARLLLVLCAALCLTQSASPAAKSSAVKLFPQITDGIRNEKNQLVMNCKVADDGLTVTDTAWDSYRPPSGTGKRWSFNQTPYTETPLVNYKFDKSLSGLQVCINVEIYNLARPWEVTESYQEILQLGGSQKINLPTWFRVPKNRLAYDFHEGKWFPSGWSLPKGKIACWEGAGLYTQTDRKGKQPMLDFGFTQVAENTFSMGGSRASWEKQCRVIGDAEWLDMTDGTNPAKWHNDNWISRGEQMKLVIPDFENAGAPDWNGAQFDKFKEMVSDFKRACPDALIGCWSIGVSKNIPLRSFMGVDANGAPSGVITLQDAALWKAKYDNPSSVLNPILNNCGLNFGNPSIYWLNGGNPAQLYAVIQEWETAKLARPDLPNVVSAWIQTEFVDNYPLSTYRFTKPDGSSQVRWIKHQAPPTYVYAVSLFAHTRMDGAYCWETGSEYSEDPADAGELGNGGMQAPVTKTFAGKTKNVYYFIKYFGFYNYHVLGMWQASQNRDIIEAPTEWFMPDLWTSTNKIWRTGDNRYPSYCSFYKEPLVRAKYSAKGNEILIVACNPYNKGSQTVKIRDPKTGKTFTFNLAGDYPVLKRLPVK
ncbi:MAG: hypothetical protein ACYC27_15340 [Armatimonadota bacterium]